MNNQAALAGLLQSRMGRTVKKGTSLPPLELGTITANMGLQVDGLPAPLADYMVCRQLTVGRETDVLARTEEAVEHTHEILVPEKMRSLRAGDRVLVAWVSNNPVIVDIVYDKSEMG